MASIEERGVNEGEVRAVSKTMNPLTVLLKPGSGPSSSPEMENKASFLRLVGLTRIRDRPER